MATLDVLRNYARHRVGERAFNFDRLWCYAGDLTCEIAMATVEDLALVRENRVVEALRFDALREARKRAVIEQWEALTQWMKRRHRAARLRRHAQVTSGRGCFRTHYSRPPFASRINCSPTGPRLRSFSS